MKKQVMFMMLGLMLGLGTLLAGCDRDRSEPGSAGTSPGNPNTAPTSTAPTGSGAAPTSPGGAPGGGAPAGR